MSWLRGNVFFDVAVSVVTPQITSSAGKPQLNDERGKDHHFFLQHEARGKTQKHTQLQNYQSDKLEKLPNRNVLTNQSRKRSPNNLKESETQFYVKETFVSFT